MASGAPSPPGVANADGIIVTSALLVGGVYAYRRVVETPGGSQRALPSFGRWATGYGVAFAVVAVVGQASPGFAAWFAVLIAAGSILVQGTVLAADVNRKVSSTQTGNPASVQAQPAAGAHAA